MRDTQTTLVGPKVGDDSVAVRCSCLEGCIVAFERWDGDDGPEFTGELYTGFHPCNWRERLQGAWTCLRGRERVLSCVVLGTDAAAALGDFLLRSAKDA